MLKEPSLIFQLFFKLLKILVRGVASADFQPWVGKRRTFPLSLASFS